MSEVSSINIGRKSFITTYKNLSYLYCFVPQVFNLLSNLFLYLNVWFFESLGVLTYLIVVFRFESV